MTDLQLVAWMLGGFSTVDEVKEAIDGIHVVGIVPQASTAHWRIADASGRQVVLEMVKDVRECPDLDIMVSGPDVVYLETDNQEFIKWMVDSYRFEVKQVPDLTQVQDEFIKISVYKKHGVEEAGKAIREKYKDRLKITISGDMWMDCMNPRVNKGEAVRQIQEDLEFLPEETMAFGDQLNDLEMLNRAYYSFAIGNARPEIKAAARFQADTNVNDGVLKILRLLA